MEKIGSGSCQFSPKPTHCVFFLPGELPRRLKVDAKVSKFAFLGLADVLDGVDMERYRKSMNRHDESLVFSVKVDLSRDVNVWNGGKI